MGEISCGSWPAGKQLTDIEKAAKLNWILGFLSGKAFESDTDLLAVVDVASISLWMDNYCRQNPLDSIVSGSFELERELRMRFKN